jgi:phosphopantetheinyl transferase
MHGNPPAHSANITELNGGATGIGAALWLGLPAAREYFDPATLSEADRTRFAALRGARRRADFEVSRALLAFVDSSAPERSLSHSAEYAALFIAPAGCSAGVDLEMERPRDVIRLARFAFHESEALAFEAAPQAERLPLFYTLWTLKEAFAKALQLPLIDALRRCVFWREAGEWRGKVPTESAWSAMVFQPRPQLFLAAALVGRNRFPQVAQREWPPERNADWPVIALAGAPASADAPRA